MAKKSFKGASAQVLSGAFSAYPPSFTYTLKYRYNGPGSFSLIAPGDRWTFIWDGNTGTVHRGIVLSLTFLTTLPGADGETFYWFSEAPAQEGKTRKWALEADPRPYINGDQTGLCTVGFYFDRDESSWTPMGLATKAAP